MYFHLKVYIKPLMFKSFLAHPGKAIQRGSHCSVEDAQSAMQLYRLVRHKWETHLLAATPYNQSGFSSNQSGSSSNQSGSSSNQSGSSRNQSGSSSKQSGSSSNQSGSSSNQSVSSSSQSGFENDQCKYSDDNIKLSLLRESQVLKKESQMAKTLSTTSKTNCVCNDTRVITNPNYMKCNFRKEHTKECSFMSDEENDTVTVSGESFQPTPVAMETEEVLAQNSGPSLNGDDMGKCCIRKIKSDSCLVLNGKVAKKRKNKKKKRMIQFGQINIGNFKVEQYFKTEQNNGTLERDLSTGNKSCLNDAQGGTSGASTSVVEVVKNTTTMKLNSTSTTVTSLSTAVSHLYDDEFWPNINDVI